MKISRMEISTIILIFLTSLTPIIEIKGGILLSYFLLKKYFYIGILVSIFASFLIPPLSFFILEFLEKFLKKKNLKIVKKFYFRFLNKFRKKAKKFEKPGLLAIFLMVAIPFHPIGGAYTASIISYLLGFDRRISIIVINVGIVISALLFTLALLGFLKIT